MFGGDYFIIELIITLNNNSQYEQLDGEVTC